MDLSIQQIIQGGSVGIAVALIILIGWGIRAVKDMLEKKDKKFYEYLEKHSEREMETMNSLKNSIKELYILLKNKNGGL